MVWWLVAYLGISKANSSTANLPPKRSKIFNEWGFTLEFFTSDAIAKLTMFAKLKQKTIEEKAQKDGQAIPKKAKVACLFCKSPSCVSCGANDITYESNASPQFFL